MIIQLKFTHNFDILDINRAYLSCDHHDLKSLG
jgi:hypothetical protein